MATPDQVTKRTAQLCAAHIEHALGRIRAEIDYAGELIALRPERSGEWQPLVAQARAAVTQAAADGGREAITKAVADAETILTPLAEVAKSYTIYAVGHAHIDMNWQWSWQETVAITNDTFTTVLKLMEEFPDFHFSQSQASVYRIIEQFNPALLEAIKERVSEGRWEVTASHWVEGDKNLAGGESLCRHLLYTRRYMQQLFGLSPEDVPIDWAPDTFGHAVTVPTYLSRGGVKYVYLHRPGAQGPERPRAFWWQGPDGSRVLVCNDMESGYNGVLSPDMIRPSINFIRETGLRYSVFVFGVGDHGGGPTRRDLLCGLDMDTWPIFPRIVFSSAKTFYERLATESCNLPTLDCELNYEFAGCYTTQTVIKKANCLSQNRTADAEAAAALASGLGGHFYATRTFEQAWRDTLFSQFHDILPGSGVHDTRTYTHGLFQNIMAMSGMEETKALRALAAAVDTSIPGADDGLPPPPPSRLPTAMGAGVGFGVRESGISAAEQSAGSGARPFILFNPSGHSRQEVVEATVWDNATSWRGAGLASIPFSVTGPDNVTLPAQVVETGGYWGHDFVRLAFPATVGSLGYARYIIREESCDVEPSATAVHSVLAHHCPYSAHERKAEGMCNAFLDLQLDMVSGGIKVLTHRPSGLKLIENAEPSGLLEYGVERPHAMSSWLIDHTGRCEPPVVTGIRRGLKGPHKATLEVSLKVESSTFTVIYELRANDPNLYIRVKGTWFERGTMETGVPVLRLSLPLCLTGALGRYEVPFGAVDRDTVHGEEVPALQWAQVNGHVNGADAGCLLLNEGKHGHSLDGGTLRLTLIRSSYDPDPLPEIGEHDIRLALMPYAGSLAVADAVRCGEGFNHPIRLMGTDIHAGSLPASKSFIRIEPKSVILSAVKRSEAGDGLILRLFDPTGVETKARVDLDPQRLGRVTAAVAVDLMERPLADSSATFSDTSVTVNVPSRGISSILVRTEVTS